MSRYIAMLRGINVSGQKSVRMDELREAISTLGYENVSTYVQSGNILFDTSEADLHKLEAEIEGLIKKVFGYDVPCLVRNSQYFKEVLENNDFVNAGRPIERCYVTFLATEPKAELIAALDTKKYAPEEFVLKGLTLYFYSPDAYGKAKMNNNFFENKLKVRATTRNWKSVNKLYEMATDSL